MNWINGRNLMNEGKYWRATEAKAVGRGNFAASTTVAADHAICRSQRERRAYEHKNPDRTF